MNKHRNQQRRFSLAEITLLSIAAPLLMAGGFVHAWLKNSHVEVKRAIDEAEKQISDHEDSINSLQVKIDRKLNIYQIRDDLVVAQSKLREVPLEEVIRIPSYKSSLRENPSVSPSTIAQVRP